MRRPVDAERLRAFMRELAAESRAEGRVYLTGGTSAVLREWRDSTVDVDIKIVPEDDRVYRAIPIVKERLSINVELAAPSDFIPELPGWRERSPFIARARRMLRDGLVEVDKLRELFETIQPQLYRYPAISPEHFRAAVQTFLAAR